MSHPVETRTPAALAVMPGVVLAATIGAAALVAKRFVPASLALPDVLVALFIGAAVVNTPVGRWLGVGPHDRGRNRYGRGLDFVGKTVLRVSVVLMGLRIEAHFFAAFRGLVHERGDDFRAARPRSKYLTLAPGFARSDP